MTLPAPEMLACPFCDEWPAFSCVETKDERRYVEMLLECNCSVQMSETLGWSKYSKMNDQQISADLKSRLTARWNTRSASTRQDDADPTASAEWNAGCYFGMEQLSKVLGVLPESVTWDAATETVDGDVQAVIGNIMRAKYGEYWGAEASRQDDAAVREALVDLQTHRDAWRSAILDKQTPFGSDDDGSYWDHELRAFDRTFTALATLRYSPDAMASREQSMKLSSAQWRLLEAIPVHGVIQQWKAFNQSGLYSHGYRVFNKLFELGLATSEMGPQECWLERTDAGRALTERAKP